MTKYREIIRLTGLGFSQRNIMASCGVSQKTVVKVQKRARELNISWPLDESMTDTELQKLMFSKESKVSCQAAHCGRRKRHFDFGVSAFPTVQSWRRPQTAGGVAARCRSFV